jgi:hypothetical protein
MSPYADNDELRSGLTVVAAQIRAWLDWDKRQRDKEPHLTTDDGTSIMALPVPFWPTHGAFENWIKLFQQCHDALNVAQASLPTKLPGELACILEDCGPPEMQSPEALAELIRNYQPTWDRILSALSSTDRAPATRL